MALDPSAKNRSSIAFLAEDGPTRLLLLGDAIADILKGPGSLYTPGGAPYNVTLMKVGLRSFISLCLSHRRIR